MQWTFEGKTYEVSSRTFEQEALFQRWQEGEAHAVVLRHQNGMPPVIFAQHLAGWRHDCASRRYEWGMPDSHLAQYSPSGMRYLAYLALHERQPQVTLQLIDRVWADDSAWLSLCGVLEQLNSPPNSKAPAGTEAPSAPAPTPV